MSNDNIFTALGRYNSASDENYLTESFVFVIKTLLLGERSIGIEILTQLCVKNNEFSFNIGEDISISTQETTEQGRPDIKVSSHNKLIYIEVKHDSALGDQQLERYNKDLESSEKPIKHVILLTRFAIDLKGQQEPYKHVRWYEVFNWLTRARNKVKDPINTYLIDSFTSFLEGKQMSINKVEWEYIKGVPAFINLMNMIEVAIQAASLHIYKQAPATDAWGFYIEGNKIWCGIGYNEPLVVIFWMDKKAFDENKLIDKPIYPRGKDDKEAIRFRLELEDKHFFSLDKDKQLEEITKFVKTAYEEAQKMRITQN